MLKREIKLSFIIVSVIFVQCRINQNISNDIDFQYKSYFSNNYKTYVRVYTELADTLNVWKNKKLITAKGICFNPFQIDSLLVFNNDSSQMISTINIKSSFRDAKMDATQIITGRKINKEWFFYFGPTTHLPHSYYQDSTYASFTWDELGYLAYENFLCVFLRFREDGSYYINENAFEHYRTPYGSLNHKGYSDTQLDSVIVADNRNIQKHVISDKEYNDIKESIELSVKPPEPWKDPKDKTIKIFESDAWKNRYKKKK